MGPPDAPASDAPAPDALVPAPAPAHYSKEDLQSMMKVCMDSILQAQVVRPTEPASHREDQLKARLPDLYYGKSHIECYHFCQQYEDHFDTADATGSNQTHFTVSFLRNRISFRWHQHKLRNQAAEGPLSWVEFKAFLRKNLGDSKAFVDNVWSRVKRDSQYQQQEVQDWASHLEHLQSILQEFDADGAPKESDLIRFFREGLKPSVKTQMEQRGWELDSWEQLIEKAIEAEAKAGLQPSFILREMDQRCPRGNRPAHTTVAKSQASASSARDPQTEPSTEKALAPDKPPHFLRSEHGETSDKKAWKEKKKK